MSNIIKGKVIVVKKNRDYYKISDETILVANDAHPDLVIIIDKLKAIVTEIDNKLYHAAIVAREFNKPLLMGIRNATKEFKTGDKVVIKFNDKIIKKIK